MRINDCPPLVRSATAVGFQLSRDCLRKSLNLVFGVDRQMEEESASDPAAFAALERTAARVDCRWRVSPLRFAYRPDRGGCRDLGDSRAPAWEQNSSPFAATLSLLVFASFTLKGELQA